MIKNKLTLAEMAVEVLTTPEGKAKTDLSLRHAETWVQSQDGKKSITIGTAAPPLHPARPEHPQLLSPRDTKTQTRICRGAHCTSSCCCSYRVKRC